MYSKNERNCKGSVSSIVKFIEWSLLHASVRRLRNFYSIKRKGKKKREGRKRTVERHFCLMFSCWLNISYILKRKEKRKKNCFLNLIVICLVLAYHFFNVLNALLCWNLLVVLLPLLIWILLPVSCHSLVPLSLILAKRHITPLKHFKKIWKYVYS